MTAHIRRYDPFNPRAELIDRHDNVARIEVTPHGDLALWNMTRVTSVYAASEWAQVTTEDSNVVIPTLEGR